MQTHPSTPLLPRFGYGTTPRAPVLGPNGLPVCWPPAYDPGADYPVRVYELDEYDYTNGGDAQHIIDSLALSRNGSRLLLSETCVSDYADHNRYGGSYENGFTFELVPNEPSHLEYEIGYSITGRAAGRDRRETMDVKIWFFRRGVSGYTFPSYGLHLYGADATGAADCPFIYPDGKGRVAASMSGSIPIPYYATSVRVMLEVDTRMGAGGSWQTGEPEWMQTASVELTVSSGGVSALS